jgi:MFS family permease
MTSTSNTVAEASRWQRSDPVVKRFPFFYGWVMLPLAMIAQMATSPGQTYVISVFNSYFRESLSLSHSQLTGAYMLGTFLACLPMSFVGAMMDRYGIRRSMTVVVILLGCACLMASQAVGLVTLFVAFLLLRMFGQGALTLLASNTLSMWFHARLGRVTGLTMVGMSASMGLFPAGILWLIHSFGWRWAYSIMGLMVWVIMLPLLFIFFRNRPEDVGQRTDGAPPERIIVAESACIDITDQRPEFRLGEAVRTRAFWIMLLVTTIWSLVGTGLVFNIVPLFESHGLTETHVAAAYTTLAVCMGSMFFIGGFLADRLPLNLLASLSILGMTSAVWILIHMHSPWSAHAYAATMGASQGLLGVVTTTLWVRYFGRAHLGKIRGSTWTMTVAGSSLGPFIMGLTYDRLGSYDSALWIFFFMFAPMILVTLFATPPRARARLLVRQR